MNEPLSILQATPCYAPAYRLGGPVRSLEGLVQALHGKGIPVRVIATDSHGAARLDVPAGWSEWRGVPVAYLHRWLAPDITPRMLTEVLRAARAADVVHVTGVFCVPTVLTLAAAAAARRPVVLSPRGALEPGALARGHALNKRAWLRLLRALFRTTTVFHATSEEEAASVHTVFGDDRVARVVPNGIDACELASASGDEVASTRPIIGTLGRVHPHKALEQLLDAAALLRARGLDFDVVLAGPRDDEAYATALTRQAARIGLGERVRFIGELYGPDKVRFLRSCRVVALPSHSENFGNVVVEALAQGRPVVASRGTPWRSLEHVGCGRWIQNSPAQLSAALEPYLRDADLARRQGEAGRRLVAERYTWSAVADEMLAVYREAIRLYSARRY